jgi:hypothetical protein
MGNKSVDLNQSNWLAALRDNLRDTHAAVKAAIKDSLRHAMAAGDILVEAKGGLKHGEWLPWLRSAGLSERTAQRYMRIARERGAIEAKYDTLSDLDVTGALRLIADGEWQTEPLIDPEGDPAAIEIGALYREANAEMAKGLAAYTEARAAGAKGPKWDSMGEDFKAWLEWVEHA